jgi:hypothetical protein
LPLSTITIDGLTYDVEEHVKSTIELIYREREENYNAAVQMQSELKRLKGELANMYQLIREWRVKTQTYKLHNTKAMGIAMNKAKQAVINAVPGLTIKQVSMMLEMEMK